MLPENLQNFYQKIVLTIFSIIIIATPIAMNYIKTASASDQQVLGESTSQLPEAVPYPVTVVTVAPEATPASQFVTPTPKIKETAQKKVANSKMATTSTLKTSTKKPAATPTPTTPVTPTVRPTLGTWSIRSVSSMKLSKDRICNQPSEDFIRQWVRKAKELNANYVAVETPYDNPGCGNAVEYTKTWVRVLRENGLSVWHRHMPLSFEGIYDVAKSNGSDYLVQISDYIKANPDLFSSGDIFTPIPEPQNGGISGITHCANGVCQFTSASHFNQWLRDAMTRSSAAFSEIGKTGIKIGYYGFDGFVAWGDNNPDWNGILEDATVSQMGNITIDHYPEAVGDTMENDLDELQQKYPNTPIIIGEWGTIQGGDTEQAVRNSMSAAKRKGVIGFNYWHLGMGGNESLINDDFSNRAQFDEVQSFFK